MQATTHSPLRTAIIYGFLTSVVCIVFTMVFYMTTWFSDLWTGYIVNGILFIGVLLAVIRSNRVMGGRASLGNLFVVGLITAGIIIAIVAASTILFHLATEPAGSNGNVDIPSQDGRHISEYSTDKRQGFWIFLLSSVFFTNGVLGALAALLGAVTVKRNQKTPSAR